MKEIMLTQGKVALVDDEDFDRLNQWKWCVAHKGDLCYAKRGAYNKSTGKQKTVLMHREIMNVEDDVLVDHKDRNGLNNCRINLRTANRAMNQANSKVRRTSWTGFRGVTKRKGRDVWRAVIQVDKRGVHLGDFHTPEEAAVAYNEAAVKYFGEFTRINDSAM